jgi:endonuclease/exonuclease/phosphatase family metal-dependent hydrolase
MFKYLLIILNSFFLFISDLKGENVIHSIVTYNIKYDDRSGDQNSWIMRKEGMIKLINSISPDILGIQEGLLHQVDYLDTNLDNFRYVGVGRDDGNKKGEFCAIYYNKNKYRLIKNSTFWLSNSPSDVSIGWDAALERICTYAQLETLNGKNKIWIFNTHFDHFGKMAREKSAKLLIKKIRNINPDGEPTVIMGDFNAFANSKVIEILKREFKDSMEISEKGHNGPIGTFNNFIPKQEITKRIDYIFTYGMEILLHEHVNKNLDNGNHISDHLPVVTKMKISK